MVGRNKFGAKKVKDPVSGRVFDSKREFNRYTELSLMQLAGEIKDLRCQVKYELLPPVYEVVDMVGKSGKVRRVRRCVERGVNYVADFVYLDKDGNEVVEDAKGHRTAEYILKRKMMLYFYSIRLHEV